MAEQSQKTGAAGGAMQGAATGAAVGGVWGAAIGGVIGGVSGFLSGGGEKDAKKLARKQAEMIRRAALENRRIAMREMEQQVGQSKAVTYASNLIDDGSTRNYRRELEREYRHQIGFAMDDAKRREEIVMDGGNAAAQQIRNAGWGQVLSGATSLGSAYAGGAFKRQPGQGQDAFAAQTPTMKKNQGYFVNPAEY